VVGPSGCGKTTMLRLIAGLETPDRGEIAIDGREVARLAPRDRDVAMVFQNHALQPHMSVYRNMAFGLSLRKTPRTEIRRRVEEAAAWLGISELLQRRPAALSGGQSQRVALGRAMVRRPKAFLLDEPLANVDARLRDELRGEIRRLHRELGATMIWVTHDEHEAMSLGDRIAVVRAGRVEQVDRPMTLYERPATRFVAGLIGCPAMNILRGHIEASDGQLAFRGDGLTLSPLDGWATRLQSHVNRPVLAGVRPEHFVSAPPASAGVATIRGRVTAVEPFGHETHAHVEAGGSRLVARMFGQDVPQVGQPLELTVATDRLHFFDPETEKAL
jgi:multiple sugar transport system ATP-binding protein